jgi:hypothetical protein
LVLSGCTEAPAGLGAWLFITVALVAAAGAAFALGHMGARHASAEQLRSLRAQMAAGEQLQTAWTWRTDAQHRLLHWQAPGQARAQQCGLFATGHRGQALAELLQARNAFSGLRMQLPDAVDGSNGWALSGTPRLDDKGCFDGFTGVASPTDAEDALHTAAQALPPLLAATPGPVLLAVDAGTGWQVLQCNAAAQALWPDLQPGCMLADALRSEPSGVLNACSTLQPGDLVDQPGRSLAGFGLMPGGARGLLLTHTAAAAPSTPTAPSETAESDNFSFTVSHDLRAPIRVVEGFTRIVKEDYGRLLDRVGNDHLDRVLGAAARMNLMIDALLTLARLSTQPLAHQPVNLTQLAGYVMDELRRSAPEREADIEIQPGLVTLGDPTLLRLVLENLLGNAWKYSARCARTEVSLRAVPHGNGHAYVVRDNGAGFDMRSSDRLFGLFQRLHSASEFPGHGVGLASVKRIVCRHGGEIWAEAEPGRGAAFFFTLGA